MNPRSVRRPNSHPLVILDETKLADERTLRYTNRSVVRRELELTKISLNLFGPQLEKERIMQPRGNERRLVWMGLGLVAGLCLAYCWPHETAQAVATDRDDRFAVCTVETQTSFGQPEAVFVLDFLTGRLTGAMLNQQSFLFTNFWGRNVAADFNLKASAANKAKYCIIPGNAYLTSGNGATMSTGVIYVGEMTSGKVIAYSFAVRNSKVPLEMTPLQPVNIFSFREAAVDN